MPAMLVFYSTLKHVPTVSNSHHSREKFIKPSLQINKTETCQLMREKIHQIEYLRTSKNLRVFQRINRTKAFKTFRVSYYFSPYT